MTSKVNQVESASTLLKQSLAYLTPISVELPVLDLACGQGRNGLYLLDNGLDVVFADKQSEFLSQIKVKVAAKHCDDDESAEVANYWPVDFECDNFSELAKKQFSAIIVFRYLHRALFPQIKEAIAAGGVVVYETFTQDQAQYGRPSNPDFLLKPNELQEVFSDWKIVHYFEGVVNNETSQASQKSAIAQIIAIKPSLA